MGYIRIGSYGSAWDKAKMKDWFTIDKIDEQTYIISEYRHWEETHCYLLIGSERCLLIDTGPVSYTHLTLPTKLHIV